MLNMGILHHPLWAEQPSKTWLVIIDEAHIYRGIFGSHIANLIRQLKRIVVYRVAQNSFSLQRQLRTPGHYRGFFNRGS